MLKHVLLTCAVQGSRILWCTVVMIMLVLRRWLDWQLLEVLRALPPTALASQSAGFQTVAGSAGRRPVDSIMLEFFVLLVVGGRLIRSPAKMV